MNTTATAAISAVMGSYERRSMMKIRIIVIAIACVLLGSLSTQTQRQTTPRSIEFDKLSDYVGDYAKRRNGQRLLVSDVPVPEKVTYEKRYKMYSFKPDPNGDVGN